MQISSKPWAARCLLLALLAFAYFVAYPEDFTSLLAPVKDVLALSNLVSPWFYALLAVAILAWTATAIWGERGSAKS